MTSIFKCIKIVKVCQCRVKILQYFFSTFQHNNDKEAHTYNSDCIEDSHTHIIILVGRMTNKI